MAADRDRIKSLIRTISDFPKPGIEFRDVTTLLKDPWGLRATIEALVDHYKGKGIEQVVAVQSRGFTLGGAVAMGIGAGCVLARKRGKLPGKVERIEYALEYGTDCIELHDDAIKKGEKCIVLDDLLATGGTANATATLVERLGGVVVGCGFIVNLPELKGTERLARYDLHWLVDFEGH